jgi:copper(I)-binding protein
MRESNSMLKKCPGAREAVIAAVILCSLFAGTATRAAEPLVATDAWVRAPAPGQKVAGAYMNLTSGVDAALVGVASPAAARAELHSMKLDAGVMKMRPVERIDLPAKQTVKLAPGGMHVMLVDLTRPLKEGDKVPLTLSVLRAGATTQVKVDAMVRNAASTPQHSH